ncbi:type II toxin-antitoxin system VapC family toxin [uncultured Rhodoblastus sp.]|uniref:type II toxin-antitoxin system VapC family toxin n=1 Tax=uncultured Rhodoblastus sp. TaxID=543037 RepID=UPI0025E35997|nr:type II toxin-antitoxin system VapC family toxin [uncultured Rhodoblastus sp.]
MRVVDTSAWIEYLLGSPTGRSLAAEMPERHRSVVPTIVQFELAKWLAREATEQAGAKAMADTMKCVVSELDTSVALRAADLAREHKLAVADAVVYATALAYDAELLTCDAHFKDLPGVIYFPKARP